MSAAWPTKPSWNSPWRRATAPAARTPPCWTGYRRSVSAKAAWRGTHQHAVGAAAGVARRCLPGRIVALPPARRRRGRWRGAKMPTSRTDQHVVRAAIRVARSRLPSRIVILSSTRRCHNARHTATVAIRWGHIVFEPAPLRGALHVPLNEGPGDTLPIRSTGGLASSRAATDVEIMVVAARSIDIRLVAALGQSKLKRRCQQRRRQTDPHGTHRDLPGLVTVSLNPLWCGVQRL